MCSTRCATIHYLSSRSLMILHFFVLYKSLLLCIFFFFFNDTATTEIYTLSLHDALPIYLAHCGHYRLERTPLQLARIPLRADRKSTRLNSSHSQISYAVFCLKKKKKNITY